MSTFNVLVELGDKLSDLVRDQSDWSQATFGTDADRSPLGAFRHLTKEAVEAEEAWKESAGHPDAKRKQDVGPNAEIQFGPIIGPEPLHARLKEELADCFLLILDASRRSGVKIMQLIEAAQAKMKVNRSRTWPDPATVPESPVEHNK